MSIVDGTGLITWEGGLFEPGSDLLRRTQWAFGRIRADGGRIILNEAGRPYGVESDQYARTAAQTASGISTVWFQWGRFLRKETPSAADPRSGNALVSEHTQGIAIDCNAPTVFDMTLRAKYFGQAGLKQTISSESWHWAIRGNPSVDLGTVASALRVSPLQSLIPEIPKVRATMHVLVSDIESTRWAIVRPDGSHSVLDNESQRIAYTAISAAEQGRYNGDQPNPYVAKVTGQQFDALGLGDR